jgi:hypothetical protein
VQKRLQYRKKALDLNDNQKSMVEALSATMSSGSSILTGFGGGGGGASLAFLDGQEYSTLDGEELSLHSHRSGKSVVSVSQDLLVQNLPAEDDDDEHSIHSNNNRPTITQRNDVVAEDEDITDDDDDADDFDNHQPAKQRQLFRETSRSQMHRRTVTESFMNYARSRRESKLMLNGNYLDLSQSVSSNSNSLNSSQEMQQQHQPAHHSFDRYAGKKGMNMVGGRGGAALRQGHILEADAEEEEEEGVKLGRQRAFPGAQSQNLSEEASKFISELVDENGQVFYRRNDGQIVPARYVTYIDGNTDSQYPNKPSKHDLRGKMLLCDSTGREYVVDTNFNIMTPFSANENDADSSLLSAVELELTGQAIPLNSPELRKLPKKRKKASFSNDNGNINNTLNEDDLSIQSTSTTTTTTTSAEQRRLYRQQQEANIHFHYSAKSVQHNALPYPMTGVAEGQADGKPKVAVVPIPYIFGHSLDSFPSSTEASPKAFQKGPLDPQLLYQQYPLDDQLSAVSSIATGEVLASILRSQPSAIVYDADGNLITSTIPSSPLSVEPSGTTTDGSAVLTQEAVITYSHDPVQVQPTKAQRHIHDPFAHEHIKLLKYAHRRQIEHVHHQMMEERARIRATVVVPVVRNTLIGLENDGKSAALTTIKDGRFHQLVPAPQDNSIALQILESDPGTLQHLQHAFQQLQLTANKEEHQKQLVNSMTSNDAELLAKERQRRRLTEAVGGGRKSTKIKQENQGNNPIKLTPLQAYHLREEERRRRSKLNVIDADGVSASSQRPSLTIQIYGAKPNNVVKDKDNNRRKSTMVGVSKSTSSLPIEFTRSQSTLPVQQSSYAQRISTHSNAAEPSSILLRKPSFTKQLQNDLQVQSYDAMNIFGPVKQSVKQQVAEKGTSRELANSSLMSSISSVQSGKAIFLEAKESEHLPHNIAALDVHMPGTALLVSSTSSVENEMVNQPSQSSFTLEANSSIQRNSFNPFHQDSLPNFGLTSPALPPPKNNSLLQSGMHSITAPLNIRDILATEGDSLGSRTPPLKNMSGSFSPNHHSVENKSQEFSMKASLFPSASQKTIIASPKSKQQKQPPQQQSQHQSEQPQQPQEQDPQQQQQQQLQLQLKQSEAPNNSEQLPRKLTSQQSRDRRILNMTHPPLWNQPSIPSLNLFPTMNLSSSSAALLASSSSSSFIFAAPPTLATTPSILNMQQPSLQQHDNRHGRSIPSTAQMRGIDKRKDSQSNDDDDEKLGMIIVPLTRSTSTSTSRPVSKRRSPSPTPTTNNRGTANQTNTTHENTVNSNLPSVDTNKYLNSNNHNIYNINNSNLNSNVIKNPASFFVPNASERIKEERERYRNSLLQKIDDQLTAVDHQFSTEYRPHRHLYNPEVSMSSNSLNNSNPNSPGKQQSVHPLVPLVVSSSSNAIVTSEGASSPPAKVQPIKPPGQINSPGKKDSTLAAHAYFHDPLDFRHKQGSVAAVPIVNPYSMHLHTHHNHIKLQGRTTSSPILQPDQNTFLAIQGSIDGGFESKGSQKNLSSASAVQYISQSSAVLQNQASTNSIQSAPTHHVPWLPRGTLTPLEHDRSDFIDGWKEKLALLKHFPIDNTKNKYTILQQQQVKQAFEQFAHNKYHANYHKRRDAASIK